MKQLIFANFIISAVWCNCDSWRHCGTIRNTFEKVSSECFIPSKSCTACLKCFLPQSLSNKEFHVLVQKCKSGSIGQYSKPFNNKSLTEAGSEQHTVCQGCDRLHNSHQASCHHSIPIVWVMTVLHTTAVPRKNEQKQHFFT